MQPLDRRLLMNLRVKDLRWYLARKRVPAHLCKVSKLRVVCLFAEPCQLIYRVCFEQEKSDLVDLIMQYNGYPTANDSATSSGSRSRPTSRRPSQPNARPPDQTERGSTDTSPDDGSWVIVDDNDPDIAVGGAAGGAEAAAASDDFKPFNIDDLKSEEEVQALTVRQMKLILTRNFVDYKGCCEKDELLVRVLRLWRERRAAQAQSE